MDSPVTTNELIKRAREAAALSASYVASFVGLESERGYWDLEWHADEVWELTLVQFLRLAVVTSIPVRTILITVDPTLATGGRPAVARPPGEEDTAAYLRRLLPSPLATIADRIGWEETALARWLANDFALAEIPLPALKDLTVLLELSLGDVVEEYGRCHHA